MQERRDEPLEALWGAYAEAYNSGDAEGCAAVFAEDGEIHSPYGPPIRGRSGIAAAHAEWFEEGEENKSLTVLRTETSGSLAMCLARYSAEVPQAGGAPETVGGVSLNTLRRQPDGTYLITVCALVPDTNATG